ncbi:MAG: YgjV family protein [Methylococcales bacterium]
MLIKEFITDLSTQHALAYAVGSIGILVEWRAYALPSGVDFRRWSAMGAVLWAMQYMLLAAWTAGLTMGTTALRTMLSGNLEKSVYKHWIAIGFVTLFCVLTTISWQGPVSLLPAFAVINTTLALFYLDNRTMRISLLFSSIAWIINDLYWQAWPALLAESVAVGINGYTIRKLLSK